jgi:DNA-binding MarR family transcriptional regulator
MTEQQAKLHKYLMGRIDDPVCPSYSEMCAAVGVASKANVSRILDGLEQRGLITRQAGVSRSVRAVRPAVDESAVIRAAREVVRVHDEWKESVGDNWDDPLDDAMAQLRIELRTA